MTRNHDSHAVRIFPTVAQYHKIVWVTIEEYLSYLLPKFEDLVPTRLGSGAILTCHKCVTLTADFCMMLTSTSIFGLVS